MGTKKYVEAVIAVILLIVLVFIAQLVVGVFGISSAQVQNTLTVATGCQSTNALATTTYCGTNSALVNYAAVGTVNGTIIPFITVIVVVALVVILLDLFGVNLAEYFKQVGGTGE